MITPELIKILVENESGIDDLGKRSRKRSVSDTRFVYCTLCKIFCHNVTLNQIASPINRNHASVINALKKTEIFLGTSSFTANKIYAKMFKKLNGIPKEGTEKKQDLASINQYWRVKHLQLVEKSHQVINSYRNRMMELERKFDFFGDDMMFEIKQLSYRETQELRERVRLFLKVKDKLNRTYKHNINNQTL